MDYRQAFFWFSRKPRIFLEIRVLLVIGIVLFFAFPVGQLTAAFDHGHWMTRAPAPSERTEVAVAALDGLIYVVGGFEKPNVWNLWQLVVAPAGELIQSTRTPVRYVGAVMAVLGTFDEAGVLPPEADPRANQLIRALIQFQSVFMKSQEPAVQEYFSSALVTRWGAQGTTVRDSFNKKGWTSESLEAMVDYSKSHPMWQEEGMKEVFRQYYLSAADWSLVQEIFQAARQRFIGEKKDIHAVFANQRGRMARGEF